MVLDNSITRFLGIPFGLSPAVADVDKFLIEKVTKKLKYWTSTHLSLAARVVVVNSVLLSTLWYFLSIWGGSKDVLRTIRGKLRNYLWAGTEENARVRVRWDDCCAAKTHGGLGLIDPDDALSALLSKWVIKGLEPGSSPLHILLRHRLGRIKPKEAGTWPQSLHWPLLDNFSSPRCTGVWARVIQAWKSMSTLVEAVPPSNHDEVLTTNLWWTDHYFGHNFGASAVRASFFARRGIT